MHEDIVVANHSTEPRHVSVELSFRADFADLFEACDDVAKRGCSWTDTAGDDVVLRRAVFLN